MISAFEELKNDRQLFRKLYRQHRTTLPSAQPHLSSPISHQKTLNILADFIIKVNQTFDICQKTMTRNLLYLEDRIKTSQSKVHRLEAYLKSRNQKIQNMGAYHTPSPKKRERIDSFAEYPQTAPETQGKQTEKTHPESHYLSKEFLLLKKEISQLNSHISSTHHYQPLDQNSQGIGDKFPEGLAHFRIPELDLRENLSSDKIGSSNLDYTSEDLHHRYEQIIRQYQKQEEHSRIKIQRYRQFLKQILIWLENLKNNSLTQLLPCQACELKKLLKIFLKMNPPTKIGSEQDFATLSGSIGRRKSGSGLVRKPYSDLKSSEGESEDLLNNDEFRFSERTYS